MKNMTITILKTALFSTLLLLFSCQNEGKKSTKVSEVTKETIIFVGTYTEKEPHVDGKAEGIYVYKMNAETGELTYQSKVTETINPSYLVPHPNRQFLYAVNEIGGGQQGTVSAFSIEPETYQLTLLNKVAAKGKAPCYISTDATGDFAFTANYATGNVGLFPIQENGRIGEAISVLNHENSTSKHARQEGPHAHFFAPKPNSEYAYAVDLGLDKIFQYQIDSENGGLLPVGATSMQGENAGSRHLTWHPKEDWIYVINELNGMIEGFKQEGNLAKLTHFQTISTLSDSTATNAACADIHMTPNGQFLYGSNRGKHNSIAMYQINQKNGELTFLGNQSTKGKTPRNFIISKDGQFLLVANQDSDNIVTFKINQKTGMLEDTGLEVAVMTPVCLKFL
ncbi:MAG: 6-phosphogluconolactonase [Paraglaciecola sp.]|jgi:6-phosphogluconolactonase